MFALVEGMKYRVTFQLENQRKPRVMIAKYLGPGGGGLQFDLRPDFGTTTLKRSEIKDVSTTLGDVHAPRMV